MSSKVEFNSCECENFTINNITNNHYYYPGKTCKKCGEFKPIEEFYHSPKTSDGRDGTCKVCRRSRRRERYEEDPQKEIARNSEYQKKRYNNDESFRLTCNLRSRLHTAVNRQGASKIDNTFNLTGCSKEWLHLWLEFTRLFYSPYSLNTHTDHTRPVASFDLSDPDEQLECFNWRNLRVIDASENLTKNARYPTEEEEITQQKLVYAFRKFMRAFHPEIRY